MKKKLFNAIILSTTIICIDHAKATTPNSSYYPNEFTTNSPSQTPTSGYTLSSSNVSTTNSPYPTLTPAFGYTQSSSNVSTINSPYQTPTFGGQNYVQYQQDNYTSTFPQTTYTSIPYNTTLTYIMGVPTSEITVQPPLDRQQLSDVSKRLSHKDYTQQGEQIALLKGSGITLSITTLSDTDSRKIIDGLYIYDKSYNTYVLTPRYTSAYSLQPVQIKQLGTTNTMRQSAIGSMTSSFSSPVNSGSTLQIQQFGTTSTMGQSAIGSMTSSSSSPVSHRSMLQSQLSTQGTIGIDTTYISTFRNYNAISILGIPSSLIGIKPLQNPTDLSLLYNSLNTGNFKSQADYIKTIAKTGINSRGEPVTIYAQLSAGYIIQIDGNWMYDTYYNAYWIAPSLHNKLNDQISQVKDLNTQIQQQKAEIERLQKQKQDTKKSQPKSKAYKKFHQFSKKDDSTTSDSSSSYEVKKSSSKKYNHHKYNDDSTTSDSSSSYEMKKSSSKKYDQHKYNADPTTSDSSSSSEEENQSSKKKNKRH